MSTKSTCTRFLVGTSSALSDNHSQTVPVVRKIMAAYCRRTDVTNAALPIRRYLWTNAFAVCNFLELYRQTGEQNYLDTALRLVEQVHYSM
jgi:hypothetical protein